MEVAFYVKGFKVLDLPFQVAHEYISPFDADFPDAVSVGVEYLY